MRHSYYRPRPGFDPDDPAEQEPWDAPGGGPPVLSDRSTDDDAPTPSFDDEPGDAEGIEATKTKLKELVADERYWRQRDPVFVANVTKAFETAYPDAGYDATGKLRRTEPRPLKFGAFDGAEPTKTKAGAASNDGGTDGAADLLWRETTPPTRNLRYDPGTDKPRIMLADDRVATGDTLAENPDLAIKPQGRDPKPKKNKTGSSLDEKLFDLDLDDPNTQQSAAGQEKPRQIGPDERKTLEREVNEEVLEFRRKTRGLGLPHSAEIEAFLDASKSRGILSNGLFDAIRSGFHKRDPADRLAAARALAETMRLFPDEASAWFEPQELAFAREVERLGADPKLADDPGRLIDLATETPDLRYFRHAYFVGRWRHSSARRQRGRSRRRARRHDAQARRCNRRARQGHAAPRPPHTAARRTAQLSEGVDGPARSHQNARSTRRGRAAHAGRNA